MDVSYKNKVLYNIFWIVFDKVIITILNIIVTLSIINHYNMNDYGIYQYVLSLIAICEVFTAFNDSRIIKKKYLEYDNSIVVSNVIYSRLFFSIIIFFISIFYVLLSKSSILFIKIFIILFINLIINQIKYGISNKYDYDLKTKTITIINTLTLILGYIIQLIVIKMDFSIDVLVLVTVLTTIVSTSLVCYNYKKTYKTKLINSIDSNLIKTVIIESLPFAIATICASIYSHCDVLMIGKLLTMNDVALYAVAVKLVGMLQFPLDAIRVSIFPVFLQKYNESKDTFLRFYQKITTILTYFIIVISLLSYILLPFIFKFIKQEYMQSFNIYVVLSLYAFFMYNAALRSNYLTLVNKGQILMITQIISVGINIILNIALIKHFGVYGAAIATVITQFLSLFLINIFFDEEGRQIFFIQLNGLNPMNLFIKI